MTDYFSNRQILEAYQKVCEGVNPNGTIDDVSNEKNLFSAYVSDVLNRADIVLEQNPKECLLSTDDYRRYVRGHDLGVWTGIYNDVWIIDTDGKWTSSDKFNETVKKLRSYFTGIRSYFSDAKHIALLNNYEPSEYRNNYVRFADSLISEAMHRAKGTTTEDIVCPLLRPFEGLVLVTNVRPKFTKHNAVKIGYNGELEHERDFDGRRAARKNARSEQFRKNLHKPNLPESVQHDNSAS